ncbi:hypothetical protein JST97_32930 [bacterium]|nr:hypothetical protein [bacterium]
MSQLQKLQQQDPAKFKQFMAQEAAKLKEAASQASGQDASRLAKLADKFQQSATSGDLSAFQPKSVVQTAASQGVQAYQQAQAQAHHHHHGGGEKAGGAMQQALSSLSADLASALGGAA